MCWSCKPLQPCIFLALAAAAAAIQSAGCSGRIPGSRFQLPQGQERGLFQFSVRWLEAGLPEVSRRLYVYLPAGYLPGSDAALPVVFIFTGWTERALDYYHNYDFWKLADRDSFIVVYPEGLDDCDQGAACQGYTSWNSVGTAESVNGGRQSCDPARQPYNLCYSSVRARKGYCHQCDWTTGYNDAAFIGRTVLDLQNSFCVDTARIFAWGCSNGGLMTHELAQKLPGFFAGIAATCGGKPHEGWQFGLLEGGPPISVLLIGGDSDHTIPPVTPPPETSWWDGWYYANVTSTTRVYRDYNGCANQKPRAFQMPFTGANMACVEEGYECRGGVRVVSCTFEGGHDVNTDTGDDDLQDEPQLAWAFFKGEVGGTTERDTCAQPVFALMTLAALIPAVVGELRLADFSVEL